MFYDLIAHLIVIIVAVPVLALLALGAWIYAKALIHCAQIERERRALIERERRARNQEL